MGTVVLDASVVLALLDPQDALHEPVSAAARCRSGRGEEFILPASVLAEVLVGAARRGEAALGATRQRTVAAFGSPYPVDEEVAAAAARRRARHRTLRLPDALVLATADAAGADEVLTGDKRWAGLDERVQVIG
ncbi:MAG TPA: PIN domain-containing protein [Streptosporangiaceae bacterium]|jgi:predicted nucleic acid-binding protein